MTFPLAHGLLVALQRLQSERVHLGAEADVLHKDVVSLFRLQETQESLVSFHASDDILAAIAEPSEKPERSK